MPELPEVETVRCGLEPVFANDVIKKVEQRRANLRFAFPENFVDRVTGARVTQLGRRAKYLLCALSTGETLIMHLGMSGRFLVTGAKTAQFHHESIHRPQHDHVVFHMSGGATVTYNDARRFGFMLLARSDALDAHPVLASLGVEPLGNQLNGDYLAKRLAGKTTSLKAALMDQRIIAGLGNIYVCEALFAAKLSPRRKAATLALATGKPGARCAPLIIAIRQVLERAIDAGGSSLRDYAHADGTLGYFQHSFSVYDREGMACPRALCSGIITRIVQSNRSTFFCPACQR